MLMGACNSCSHTHTHSPGPSHYNKPDNGVENQQAYWRDENANQRSRIVKETTTSKHTPVSSLGGGGGGGEKDRKGWRRREEGGVKEREERKERNPQPKGRAS